MFRSEFLSAFGNKYELEVLILVVVDVPFGVLEKLLNMHVSSKS